MLVDENCNEYTKSCRALYLQKTKTWISHYSLCTWVTSMSLSAFNSVSDKGPIEKLLSRLNDRVALCSKSCNDSPECVIHATSSFASAIFLHCYCLSHKTVLRRCGMLSNTDCISNQSLRNGVRGGGGKKRLEVLDGIVVKMTAEKFAQIRLQSEFGGRKCAGESTTEHRESVSSIREQANIQPIVNQVVDDALGTRKSSRTSSGTSTRASHNRNR